MRAEHTAPAKGAAPAAEAKEPVERSYNVWERTVTLPPGIVPERIEARSHNGLLEVHVPRAPELAPCRIEVKT